MKELSSLIRYDKEFSAYLGTLTGELEKKKSLPIILNGLSGGATYAALKESLKELKKTGTHPSLIIVPSDKHRREIASSLRLSGIRVGEYKPRDLVFHNISASHDTERERLLVLSALITGELDTVITTPSALLSYTVPRDILSTLCKSYSVGDEISPETLSEALTTLGFKRVDSVENAGQFSKRGGIIDLWHSAESEPIRIEFFGDEIDRLVYFDPITQRTTDSCKNISLIPASEVMISPEAKERIKKATLSLIEKAKTSEQKEKLKSELAIINSDLHIDFRDKHLGLVYERSESLIDYMRKDGKPAVFMIDDSGVYEELKTSANKIEEARQALLESFLVTKEGARYSADKSEFEDFLCESLTVHINTFGTSLNTTHASGLFGIRTRRTVAYGDNPSMLLEDILTLRKTMYKTVILAENKQSAKNLCDTLVESDVAVRPIYDSEDFDFTKVPEGSVLIDVGEDEGFDLIAPRIAILSMKKDEGRAVMAQRRRQRILRRVGGATERLMSHADLSVGDYVVHANYGIGLFEGMQTVTVDGITKDYITIRYAGTDKLFVPCDRLEYIGKYIGEKDKDGKVKLSKMGGADWNRAKSKAKAGAKDIAKDLIKLYAERQRLPGFAFPEDSELEESFAADFEYEETESQLLAIQEIKADMMRPVPMNRLLCGDVGFGKTEVALRAAFKAIMGGKQVALLVPTTILALQHYQTALARMRSYPVTVAMISRFTTKKEQELVLRKTKRGEVDILIGTHKLFSKNVEFRDLGLLIIDEEQRFGVAQKEKLKEIARNVDVLSLSATPIPRTLSMAMNGISDMSILDEAPGERRPVQTYVLEHDETIINDAITREINRGGQVLYLYNRVEEIEYIKDRIETAIPKARVAVAHGQMDKDELEDIWQTLVRGEIDVLVCTTIIETGIDLPSANTLIIEGADRMGLSQLHQIRGRVGRSRRQAYAYFTYRRGKALSEIAEKRLAAIREFAEFGAGFKVALRDLEIRGAGNLLGVEQHGYIDSVGYDLYVKLLSEAVLEESGRMPEKAYDSVVEVRVSANIPERYIPSGAQRMEMYKKISLITEKADMDDIYDEFLDRFGEVPKEVNALLKISLLRVLSSKAKIKKTEILPTGIAFHQESVNLAVWSELFGKYAGLTMRAMPSPTITYRPKKDESGFDIAIKILTDYISEAKETTR